jgi:hypothetical protein
MLVVGVQIDLRGGDLRMSFTVDEILEPVLDSRRPFISKKTTHEYGLNIRTLSVFFGEMRLEEITADQVRAYQKARMTQCGPFSINHECCVLSQMRKRIGKPFEDYQPLPLPKGIETHGKEHEIDQTAFGNTM